MRRSLGSAAAALGVILAFASVGSAALSAPNVADLLVRSDTAYLRRSSSVDPNRRVDPGPIREAIALAGEAVEAVPGSLPARVRLVRALYFAGDHSNEPENVRLGYLERCREVGDEGMDRLADELASGERFEDLSAEELLARVPEDRRTEIAGLYYWTSLCWGVSAQLTGTFAAIRDGVAGRLYEMSVVVLALDPGHHIGGAHRLLSYMHATLPSVPFISGWVDRERAVPEAEAALAFAPERRENRVIYALALHATRPERRDEAVSILREVAALEPRDEHRAEDVSIQALALKTIGEEPATVYGFRDPDPDGTGRTYLGREISRVMGHLAAGWLERPEREKTEKPAEVVRAMELAQDAIVADVGAGTGYFTFRLAEAVPEGRVLAVDIQPPMLERIDRQVRRRGVDNVRTILGSSLDPRLPENAVDAVLLVDAYHEFSHPREMGDGIQQSLAPGGRVFLVEYRGEDPAIPIKPLHKMTVAQVRLEMEAVGLRFVENRDFLPDQHFLVFEKP